jgi:hypothetical protein
MTKRERTPLPERIRLVKILRAHGLRTAERLRADELKSALKRLGLVLGPDEPDESVLSPRTNAWSGTSSVHMSPANQPENKPMPTHQPPPDPPEDPILPRFKEPELHLPDGRASFIRLIAVSPERLYATWDLTPEARARAGEQAELVIRFADAPRGEAGAEVLRTRVHPGSYGWYVEAPEERARLVADLILHVGAREEILATSNDCIVPPARPARPGASRRRSVLWRGGPADREREDR